MNHVNAYLLIPIRLESDRICYRIYAFFYLIPQMYEIGRASCRERVYVWMVAVAVEGIRAADVTGVQTCALPIFSCFNIEIEPFKDVERQCFSVIRFV